MENPDRDNIYFLGIGGIGMSALARYFHMQGKNVHGYDKTPSKLTDEMQSEGITMHFEDNPALIPEIFLLKEKTLVIYTPAIPGDHQELGYFRKYGYDIFKRSEILGFITREKNGLAVAGTHGKTTISTLLAHLLHVSPVKCSAFLGGVSNNYLTNFLYSGSSPHVVVEADEYDRSFLHLSPQLAIVTAIDPDHLDIYGDFEGLKKGFEDFLQKVKKGGIAIFNEAIPFRLNVSRNVKIFTYSGFKKADYYAFNHLVHDGGYQFDLMTPGGVISNFFMPLPGKINVENSVAAITACLQLGIAPDELKIGLAEFKGVRRRFDFRVKADDFIFMDDYAHHPKELEAVIQSVKDVYPGRHVTGIFQPHLYSRTRDLVNGFAKSLDMLDRAYILDIYPAREKPIKGITSKLIFDRMKLNDKYLIKKEKVINTLEKKNLDILMTLGAGDIDTLVEPLKRKMIGQ